MPAGPSVPDVTGISWRDRNEPTERPRSPDVDTSISGQVPILEALLDHWGLQAVHLVAHDIGGGIAQRFCIFHPERLRSLTVIDVVSFDSYPSKRTKQQMKAGLDKLCQLYDKCSSRQRQISFRRETGRRQHLNDRF